MDSDNIEAIKNQERLIEREIAERIPLVSDKIPITELKNDYQLDDDIYQSKIKRLEEDYAFLRRTRPDGNCFFRAFGFAYFESLLKDSDSTEIDRFLDLGRKCKRELIALGLPSVTVDDFYDVFLELQLFIQQQQPNSRRTPEQLLERFGDQTISDYIVVYFRLITSGYLQKNADKFANFIVGSANIVDFCKTEVEPMYKESDHIHVVALTSALQVRTRIVYMDRADGSLSVHEFPEQLEQPSDGCRVHLLYRPGHYDVLYTK